MVPIVAVGDNSLWEGDWGCGIAETPRPPIYPIPLSAATLLHLVSGQKRLSESWDPGQRFYWFYWYFVGFLMLGLRRDRTPFGDVTFSWDSAESPVLLMKSLWDPRIALKDLCAASPVYTGDCGERKLNQMHRPA
ncbi:hypothetical protein XENTR_v10007372 [Xenopus tropicalis]|nr:hypothetical protein XENTR_v10007372 [Xenopus tropicalis]